MSRSRSESLLGLTESFFHNYLQHTRGVSAHTVRAYRDALKLFYLFLADQKRKPMSELVLEDIQSDAVLGFLNHVESRRGNSAVTRNCRLAAVRSFVQHLLRQDVTRAGQYGRILAIRNKKALRRAPTYLESPSGRHPPHLPISRQRASTKVLRRPCSSPQIDIAGQARGQRRAEPGRTPSGPLPGLMSSNKALREVMTMY
jgi:integrase/recombinase XerD